MEGCIRCTCGNRVREQDLIEAGLFLGEAGAGAVYVKFICSRCERVAQRTLSIDEWDEGRILFEDRPADCATLEPHDKGLITFAEIKQFSQELDQSEDPLAPLRAMTRFPKRRGRGDAD